MFKDRLKLLRQENKWSKKEVAEKLDLSIGAYANYEYGNREPNQKILIKISVIFNVSLDYLIKGTNVITISTSEYERLKKIENKFNELSKSK